MVEEEIKIKINWKKSLIRSKIYIHISLLKIHVKLIYFNPKLGPVNR